MGKYTDIWNEVKRVGKAEVVLHKGLVHSVKYGVIDTKAIDNAARKKVGLIKYPELVFQMEKLSDAKVKMTISLLYPINL